MRTVRGKISSDYGWEITVCYKVRNIADGVSFFDMIINWDRFLADHSPRFEFRIILLNWTVVEINIYYLHHRDEFESVKIAEQLEEKVRDLDYQIYP